MRVKYGTIFLLALFCAFGLTYAAEPVIDKNGKLIGVKNITIDDIKYDMEFIADDQYLKYILQ